MTTQKQADIEDLESNLIQTQNNLEQLKDDFDHEKIDQKEFSQKTFLQKEEMLRIQKALDDLEEL